MDDGNLARPPLTAEHVQERHEDSPEPILGWLDALELGDEPLVASASLKRGADDVDRAKEAPRTPDRKSGDVDRIDEPSPTDTNFSSIFDSPKPRKSAIGSPTPSLRAGDDSLSKTTASSVVDGNDDWLSQCVHEAGEAVHAPPEAVTEVEEVSVLENPNLSSPGDELLKTPPHSPTPESPLQPPDPDKPHFIFITSCLQCILAGLPCSRTPPTCSRCKRAGYGDVCLLHRRKTMTERILGDMFGNSRPLLLKVEGEEEGVWERKLNLFHELHQTWLEREERKNWVLPPVESPQGSYRQYGHKEPRTHPGEGLGRLSFRELRLA